MNAFRLLPVLLACVLAACAPVTQPFTAEGRGAPRLTETSMIAADNHPLPLQRWLAESPRAVVLALHGFNDYNHAFEETGTALQESGITLYAYDQRGFGRNGDRGIWAGTENLEQDLIETVAAISAAHPGLPVYLMGESMGGAVILSALADHPAAMPSVKGAVLVAPALWGAETMNGFYRASLWFGAHTLPAVTVTGKNLHILASDNIPMLRALGKDPLVIKETRIDAIYGMVDLMGRAYRSAPKIDLPLLVLYGAKDQVIPKEPIMKSLAHFNQDKVTIAFYDNGWHMLLRDLEGPLVRQDVASWVLAPDAPLPSHSEQNWQARMKAAPDPRAAMPTGPHRARPKRWHQKPATLLVF